MVFSVSVFLKRKLTTKAADTGIKVILLKTRTGLPEARL